MRRPSQFINCIAPHLFYIFSLIVFCLFKAICSSEDMDIDFALEHDNALKFCNHLETDGGYSEVVIFFLLLLLANFGQFLSFFRS